MFKNVASQKLAVYAHDTIADIAKTGDAANITAQISKDGAATAASDDVSPTELDATDAPGIYIFDLTQAETNANLIVFCAVSSTAGIQLVPVIIHTAPANFTTLGIDANGRVDLSKWLGTAVAVGAGLPNVNAAAVGGAAPMSVANIVAGILAGVIEGAITLQEAQRLMLAVLTGKVSGGGTATVIFRDTGDAKDRITATVTEVGDRTAVARDAS